MWNNENNPIEIQPLSTCGQSLLSFITFVDIHTPIGCNDTREKTMKGPACRLNYSLCELLCDRLSCPRPAEVCVCVSVNLVFTKITEVETSSFPIKILFKGQRLLSMLFCHWSRLDEPYVIWIWSTLFTGKVLHTLHFDTTWASSETLWQLFPPTL